MSPVRFIVSLDSTPARVVGAKQPTPIDSASLLAKRYVKIGASKPLGCRRFALQTAIPSVRDETLKTSSGLILTRLYCEIMNGTRMELLLLSAGAVLTKLQPCGSAQRLGKEEG